MRLLVVFVAVVAAALPASVVAQEVPLALRPGEVLLQVEAEGQSLNRPDVMNINAGVVTNGSSAAAAMDANRVQADRMLKALETVGVAAADVQTSDLSVEPVFAEDGQREVNRSKILGYVARNTVDLRLRDLGRAPAIIDTLFASGANNVHGPNFSLADPKPAERQARFSAVAAAREEADTYAAAFGMKVARVIRASERGDFSNEGEQTIVITGSRVPRTRLEHGKLKTRIHLWIDYALLPK